MNVASQTNTDQSGFAKWFVVSDDQKVFCVSVQPFGGTTAGISFIYFGFGCIQTCFGSLWPAGLRLRLVVEFPATGGAVPSYQIRTVKLIRYITHWDYFVLGCELVFCVFILYYVVEEILELRIHKFAYFKSIWNILDILVILVGEGFRSRFRSAFRPVGSNGVFLSSLPSLRLSSMSSGPSKWIICSGLCWNSRIYTLILNSWLSGKPSITTWMLWICSSPGSR